MKTNVLIIICSIVLYSCISIATKQDGGAAISSEKTVSVNFNTEVLPILQTKCSPCHFPGGKMYGKMPFDKGVTILDHEAGILRRIKDQPAARLIRQFILQHQKGN